MPNAAPTRRRWLPSLGDLVFSTTLVLLFLLGEGATRLLGDSDTGWHIRTGEWILAQGAVPRHDLFSFSKPGGEWFAWEWLTDVLLALVHRLGGLAGVALAAALLIALIFTCLHRFLLRRGADVLVATAVTLAAAYASSVHWLARPHLVGWALALAFYWILEETPVERRAIFWLLPLTTLWANLHGSFVLGLVLILFYGAGELARAALATGDDAGLRGREALRRARSYGLLAAACAAASLLNPYLFRVHLHIFSYLRDSYINDHITEFFSPNFHASTARFFEALLLLGAVAAVWAVRRGRYVQAGLVLVFAHFSLVAARHIPLFVLFAAPLVADALTAALAAWRSPALPGWLSGLLGSFGRFSADIRRIELAPRFHALSGLAVLLVLATLQAPDQKLYPRFHPRHFPVAAADHLEKSGFSGNVFSTDQWSSYLIYRAFPRVRVFMDGRSDYYGPKLGELYLNLMSVHHTWHQTLDRYGVQAVLLPVDSGLTGALKESSRWKVAYDDGVAILFQPVGETAPLVAAASDDSAIKRKGACCEITH